MLDPFSDQVFQNTHLWIEKMPGYFSFEADLRTQKETQTYPSTHSLSGQGIVIGVAYQVLCSIVGSVHWDYMIPVNSKVRLCL